MHFLYNKEKNNFIGQIEHGDTWNYPYVIKSIKEPEKNIEYHRLIALHSPGNLNKPYCSDCILSQTDSCFNHCFGHCINTYFRPYEEVFGEDL